MHVYMKNIPSKICFLFLNKYIELYNFIIYFLKNPVTFTFYMPLETLQISVEFNINLYVTLCLSHISAEKASGALTSIF